MIRKVRQFYAKLRVRPGQDWESVEAVPAFKKRVYRTYDQYVAHQAAKLDHKDLTKYDVKYREVLRLRLERLEFLKPGASVLCLAARLGTEVKAFIDVGCFAIGIDLNPGKNNRYVVVGDFHDLQYASGSVDAIFTNSLDHTFDISKLLGEVTRVLKPDGRLIVEAMSGSDTGRGPGDYESFWWSSIDDLVAIFEKAGFELTSRERFGYPWKGEQLCLRRTGSGAAEAGGAAGKDSGVAD